MSEQDATWVYAVVPQRPAPQFTAPSGVAGEPVRLVAHGDVCAVVGSVRAAEVEEEALRRHLGDPEWLERAVRSHHAVVESCFDVVPTVPFRLATVYHDDHRAAEMLAQRHTELVDALTTVARRAEWGVQAYAARPELAADDVPTADPARPGTAYLLRRRAQRTAADAARRGAAEAAEQVHSVLQQLAVAAGRQPPAVRPPTAPDGEPGPGGGLMVLNAAYLVEDHRRDEFTDAVRDLGERHPALRLRVTGPWPAYSFVEIGREVAT